jgi:hypothetical protein
LFCRSNKSWKLWASSELVLEFVFEKWKSGISLESKKFRQIFSEAGAISASEQAAINFNKFFFQKKLAKRPKLSFLIGWSLFKF